MRTPSLFVALAATFLIASCSSDSHTGSSSPTSGSSTSTIVGRGATVGEIGEPVERSDGAYKLTLVSGEFSGVCEATPESPGDTDNRTLVATFALETSNTPLKGEYLSPSDFYSVTGQTVQATPDIGGRCESISEGRSATNDPLPNARILRTETLLVPIAAQRLGYRDPVTRQAFEWDITRIPAATPEAPATPPPPTTPEPTTAPRPTPAPGPVWTPPTTSSAPNPDSCVEGSTRYSENSGITYTCRNGTWHEGPYN